MLGRGKQFVQPEIADQQYDQKWNRNQERVQVGMNCRFVHDSLRYAPACIKARTKKIPALAGVFFVEEDA